ncbi:MAG: tetratricopeptide repeat protein [Flammeovirgaceae bacterium]|nr:tetratricopeptide repeat protein [Flammeovirgaceae bacterium]
MNIKKIAIIISLLIASGCVNYGIAQKSKKKKKKEVSQVKKEFPKNVSPEKSVDQAEYIFAEGIKHVILEDYKKALVLLEESERLNPDNPTTKFKIAQVYYDMEKYDEALPYAVKALQIENSNIYYYLLLADIHKAKKEYEQVVKVYKDLLDIVDGSEEYYFDLASAYLHLSDYKNAIEAYNKAETIFGLNEAVVRQKQRIYLNINDLDAALGEGQKLVDAFPSNSGYSVAQAQMLFSNDRFEDAEAILTNLFERLPDDPEAQLMLAKIYQKQGKTDEADKLMETAFMSNDLEVENKLEVLRNYLQKEEDQVKTEKGKKLAEIVVMVHPESDLSNGIYGDFLLFEGKKEESRGYYLKSLKANGDSYEIWQKVINIDWEFQQFDSVVVHSESALEFFPNQAQLYLYNGTGNYVLQKYEESMESLEQGKMLATDPELKIQFNAQLGDVYNSLKEYKKSDDAFEDVLKQDPRNEHVLNNYGYFLSVRKENLKRAKELGEQLMKLAPNSPTYQDTYGWILFVSGDYKNAVKILEKAANDSDNGTIIEHYGDALFKTNKKDEALIQWKKAKDLGGTENEELLDKKINQKDLIE